MSNPVAVVFLLALLAFGASCHSRGIIHELPCGMKLVEDSLVIGYMTRPMAPHERPEKHRVSDRIYIIESRCVAQSTPERADPSGGEKG